MFKGSKLRDWNIFTIHNKIGWQKYFYKFKTIITPRFLYELIVPQDILNIANNVATSTSEKAVFRFIIAASIFNGILAGSAGSVGWGIFVMYAVEILMALQIAKHVGIIETITLPSLKKIIELFSAAGLTALTVAYGFKAALNVVFNILGAFPVLGFGTAIAEIITTLFYGLFIYLCFIEIKSFENTEKSISITNIIKISLNAVKFVTKISTELKSILVDDSVRVFTQIKQNVSDAWYGVIDVSAKIKGEIFLAGCLAYSLEGKIEKLQGPFAQLWLEAWRAGFSNKLGADADYDEIRELALSYDNEQINSLKQHVTSKFYEILETKHENADGDEWSAELFPASNHPISDAVFYNQETGDSYTINYKFSENANYIENHIQLYPDVPIISTPEVAEKINSPLVVGGNYEYESVLEISEDNFETILNQKHSMYVEAGAATAGALSLGMHLFPFFMAYYRNNINREQLGIALQKFVPEITARTINRIAMIAFLGPIYATFLVAGFTAKSVLYGFDDDKEDEDASDSHPAQGPPPPEPPQPKKEFTRREFILSAESTA